MELGEAWFRILFSAYHGEVRKAPASEDDSFDQAFMHVIERETYTMHLFLPTQ